LHPVDVLVVEAMVDAVVVVEGRGDCGNNAAPIDTHGGTPCGGAG
jgi:hypothetical protein